MENKREGVKGGIKGRKEEFHTVRQKRIRVSILLLLFDNTTYRADKTPTS